MEIVLFGLLAVLLIFMIFNTRKRNKQMKAEREEKARKTVPGAKVLLQGGLYGTIVSFDPDDLDKPAEVEMAPGVVFEVHSQAILRIVEDTDTVEDDELETDADDEPTFEVETPEQTRARLDGDADSK